MHLQSFYYLFTNMIIIFTRFYQLFDQCSFCINYFVRCLQQVKSKTLLFFISEEVLSLDVVSIGVFINTREEGQAVSERDTWC